MNGVIKWTRNYCYTLATVECVQKLRRQCGLTLTDGRPADEPIDLVRANIHFDGPDGVGLIDALLREIRAHATIEYATASLAPEKYHCSSYRLLSPPRSIDAIQAGLFRACESLEQRLAGRNTLPQTKVQKLALTVSMPDRSGRLADVAGALAGMGASIETLAAVTRRSLKPGAAADTFVTRLKLDLPETETAALQQWLRTRHAEEGWDVRLCRCRRNRSSG